ncbi:uncharacterized protein LOC133525932 [Cydia pomonella]|uniref:uncharacterized protein LOC133525932 n=1 Tax=Cydia pomonella TaxID=82600 RepID=UPI002ADE1A1C|nr:uncharacterized protein LOC133525932 [Cydia pomonella]
MLKGLLFLALIYLCQGYMNSRLQNWFQEKRQIGFLPAAAGIDSDSGKPRGLAPYPQPWRQADRRGFAPYPQPWRQADRRGPAPYPQPWRQADRRGPAPFLQPRRQAEDSRQPPDHPNHDNSHFCPMPGMVQRGARLIEDYNAYPWLARVLHVRCVKLTT